MPDLGPITDVLKMVEDRWGRLGAGIVTFTLVVLLAVFFVAAGRYLWDNAIRPASILVTSRIAAPSRTLPHKGLPTTPPRHSVASTSSARPEAVPTPKSRPIAVAQRHPRRHTQSDSQQAPVPAIPNQAIIPPSQPTQQNCVVTGGTNYGHIEQHCTPPPAHPHD